MEDGRLAESRQDPDVSMIGFLVALNTDTWSEQGACGPWDCQDAWGLRSLFSGFLLLHLPGVPLWKGRKGGCMQTSGRHPLPALSSVLRAAGSHAPFLGLASLSAAPGGAGGEMAFPGHLPLPRSSKLWLTKARVSLPHWKQVSGGWINKPVQPASGILFSTKEKGAANP